MPPSSSWMLVASNICVVCPTGPGPPPLHLRPFSPLWALSSPSPLWVSPVSSLGKPVKRHGANGDEIEKVEGAESPVDGRPARQLGKQQHQLCDSPRRFLAHQQSHVHALHDDVALARPKAARSGERKKKKRVGLLARQDLVTGQCRSCSETEHRRPTNEPTRCNRKARWRAR
ncbi:hypothetical protein B0J13DRAFT_547442 [Dactylonectria estremocensis]|uniref:Uncharacterized protein n=1 Tax=Dactylonectria estremocensis TaxID=1079267 RepID=A0A9P9F3K2_9HYPO|nr:hypothetical protein B0J13DRAFT_547442 [Dactylonectria estremocensis]